MIEFDEKFKPCPLCGSENIYLEEKDYEQVIVSKVGCAKCGLSGYKNFLYLDSDERKKVVLDYWNNRPNER